MTSRPLGKKALRELCAKLGELGDGVRASMDAGDFEAAIEVLSEHVEGRQARPEAMVLLASALVSDALEVMVDRMEEHAERAVALLERASRAGYDDPAVQRLHASLLQRLERERRESARVEARTRKILEARDVKPFSASQIGDCAHALWSRGEHARAAVLFRLAAERARGEPPPVVDGKARLRNDFNYDIRAVICSVRAGELARGAKEVEEALSFDFVAGAIYEDRHMTEWLFFALLEREAAAEDWSGFRELWGRATQRGRELDFPFPGINAHQEQLLEMCRRGPLRDLIPPIAAAIRARRRVPPRLAKHLAKVENEA